MQPKSGLGNGLEGHEWVLGNGFGDRDINGHDGGWGWGEGY